MSANNPLDIDKLANSVHAGLRSWQNPQAESDVYLNRLLLFKEHLWENQSNSSISSRLAVSQLLLKSIEELQKEDDTAATILKLRFLDNTKIRGVAYQLGCSEDQVKRYQRDAIHQLAQIIYTREIALREIKAIHLEGRLEAPSYNDGHLYGVDAIVNDLVEQIVQKSTNCVLFITGIGGIGKTSLADNAIRKVIRYFQYDDIFWLHNKQSNNSSFHPSQWNWLLGQIYKYLFDEEMPAHSLNQQKTKIRDQLKSKPYLIAIDNLETEDEAIYLLNQLKDFGNPTKFLLTSRVRPPGQAGIYILTLNELSATDSFALMRHHARTIGITDINEAPDKVLKPVFAATGGNPLAIKIVISLTAVIPISRLLFDLTEASVTEIEEMYKYIYWKAWHALRIESQAILRMMPLAAEHGVTEEQMRAMTNLPEKQLWLGIHELVSRSLLEVRGTIWERRYGIHQLTESFLKTEVIHWPEELL